MTVSNHNGCIPLFFFFVENDSHTTSTLVHSQSHPHSHSYSHSHLKERKMLVDDRRPPPRYSDESFGHRSMSSRDFNDRALSGGGPMRLSMCRYNYSQFDLSCIRYLISRANLSVVGNVRIEKVLVEGSLAPPLTSRLGIARDFNDRALSGGGPMR